MIKTVIDDFTASLTNNIYIPKNNAYFHKFEIYIDTFDEIVRFISTILDFNTISNNELINKIKIENYLRFQENKPQSFNFISMLAKILLQFKICEESLFKHKMRYLVSQFESIIIIIEVLTKANKV